MDFSIRIRHFVDNLCTFRHATFMANEGVEKPQLKIQYKNLSKLTLKTRHYVKSG